MKITTCTVVLAVIVFAMFATNPAAAQGVIGGKLWVVSTSQASNVSFPAPSVTPDVNFATNGIAYIGQGPSNCITVGKFLATCSTPAISLTYSGAINPILGKAVTSATKLNATTYGELIEFEGNLTLTNGQQIQILHDDGVALEIDDVPVSGFSSGIGFPVLESVTFTGSTGTHDIHLLYGNVASTKTDGAWLLFFPQLF